VVDRVGWANLRHLDVLDRVDGAFDVTAHTVDVRPISSLEGWHGIKKVGFFVWRLFSYPLASVPARRSGLTSTASPSASSVTLFTCSRAGSRSPPTRTATEINVPTPIRPTASTNASPIITGQARASRFS